MLLIPLKLFNHCDAWEFGGGGDLAGYNTSCQHLVYTSSANVIRQNHNFTCERPVADMSSIHLCNWATKTVVFQIKQSQGVPIVMTNNMELNYDFPLA